MIIQVSAKMFYKYKRLQKTFLCFYFYEDNHLNKQLVSEIEKLEKEHIIFSIFKIDLIEYKNYFDIINDEECNHVFLYNEQNIVLDIFPPNIENKLSIMFKKYKEINDSYDKKLNLKVIEREFIAKNFISPVKQPRSKRTKKEKYYDVGTKSFKIFKTLHSEKSQTFNANQTNIPEIITSKNQIHEKLK